MRQHGQWHVRELRKMDAGILVENSEEKRTLGRPMHRLKDNMNNNLK